MPSYKLIYFNSRGRAEVPRMIMAYAGIEYEDVRLEKEEWEKIKPTTPYGQLPVLEVDGEMICQSQAISRYLAKKAGLMGKSDLDDAKIDMLVNCLEDYLRPLPAIWYETDEEKKATLRKKFQDSLPEETKKIENLLHGDYFVGNEMTLADINVAYVLGFPTALGFEMNYDDLPKLKALRERVFGQEKIAEWIAKRPETKM